MTACLTVYMKVFKNLFQYEIKSGWSIDDLIQVQPENIAFKQKFLHVFSNFKPSGLGTCMWYAINDLAYDITDIRRLNCLHAGFYELAHRIFKDHYHMTSKRVKNN